MVLCLVEKYLTVVTVLGTAVVGVWLKSQGEGINEKALAEGTFAIKLFSRRRNS